AAAVFSKVSRSLPNTLTEFSPLTPDAASSTLSWMYCEKLNSTPGNCCPSASVMSCVSLSLSTPTGQVSKGFSGTKNSALKKPVASVPSSGRPCCDTTDCTSGYLLISTRMRLTYPSLSSSDTDWGNVARTHRFPSSSEGRNSRPSERTAKTANSESSATAAKVM